MDDTLAGLLRPYNQSEIARKVKTTRSRVNRWAHDDASPEVSQLPDLAAVLRIDLTELVAIVAKDSKRRALRGISGEAAA